MALDAGDLLSPKLVEKDYVDDQLLIWQLVIFCNCHFDFEGT